MANIINIAAYKFVSLTDLKPLRNKLFSLCRELRLRGTILLSTEGINLFVAGGADGITSLLATLREIRGLEDLAPKLSPGDHQPFNRMLVRIKKEIIAFGIPDIDPAKRTSPKLTPSELKQMLDKGNDLTLLDTRNDYEVKLGTFKNARNLGLTHFRDFPEAAAKLPEELKQKPIIMFCTGGIRCEKAGPFMEQLGFKNIFQLDGGILKYFEECGGAHYEGECFVFDQRVGVDPALNETDSTQCFKCLTPLSLEDQKDPRYVAGKSCPFCHKTSAEENAARIQQRQTLLRKLAEPLPGSMPYDNFRPLSVPGECDGSTLIDFLQAILKHIPRREWEELCAGGLMLDPNRQPVGLDRVVRAGERYFHKLPDLVEPPVNAAIQILHEDQALIVLNKPAPLPVHPGGRFNRNTVQHLIHKAYHPERPHAAHRLDANTTGLLVLTRTRHFASKVQPQFARGEVMKLYLVKIRGEPREVFFVAEAPISDQAGELGSRCVDHENGLPARTEFRVLRRNLDATTLLEARPLTGRTNQIRLHLWQLGFPICGDQAYLANGKIGCTQTIDPSDEPLCLHAWRIELIHPITRQRVRFEAAPPAWAGGSLPDQIQRDQFVVVSNK